MATQTLDPQEENKLIAYEYRNLLRISYQTLTAEDKKQIRAAFDVAVDAHSGQRRKSGEAYIFHPIAVSKIVASEIGMDAVSIVSALLHDVVEDTSYTIEDIERIFGGVVANIVDGLTKIPAMKSTEKPSLQAENFRKTLLTMNKDIRVILIKIADRLHNMKTIDSMPKTGQAKIASETLYIYAPIAHRLGLHNIKNQLEDLGLKYTDPQVYKDLEQKIEDSKEEQEAYIQNFIDTIKTHLEKSKIKAKIIGRPKTIYSIWQKMRKKNISYEDVFDKFAIRVTYKSKRENEKFLAWKIYSIITDHFQPNPTRLKDWITSPKSTGYEALHVTVMGNKGRWVEVQIRSERMNDIAERGYAAHYKYKYGSEKELRLDRWLNVLRDSFENGHDNAVDFVNELRMDFYEDEITVFTPKGEEKTLPRGASLLDFAFLVHTEIGLATKGGKVNGSLVTPRQILKTGDQVRIITSEKTVPKAEWLNYVKTPRAKSAIRAFYKKQQSEYEQEGLELLKRKLKHLKIDFNEDIVKELLRFLSIDSPNSLYYKTKIGSVSNTQLRAFADKKHKPIYTYLKKKIGLVGDKPIKSVKPLFGEVAFGQNLEKLPYKAHDACKPIAGDSVFGFKMLDDSIMLHRSDCPDSIAIRSNYAYRILPAQWLDVSKENFLVDLKMKGIDNVGIVREITALISETTGISMEKINFKAKDGVFKGKITISVKNSDILKKLMFNIKKIKGIDHIERV